MTVRRSSSVFALLAVLFLATAGSAPLARAETGLIDGQNIASDTFYTLDPANASITVRMEATVGSASSNDLTSVMLFAVPGADNLEVRQDGTPLVLPHILTEEDTLGTLTVVEATLLKPLRGALTADIVMTYTVGARSQEPFHVESGAIEMPFVSQGPGSFVSVDMPVAADNYLDPGCLKAASQPDSVTSAGYERWVCGEATLLSLSADDPETLERCARLDDRCRQLIPIPYIASAQSISDHSLIATLEKPVTVNGREVSLAVRYFKGDASWAQTQFDTAVQVFPMLEDFFGFSYPHDTLTLRQSYLIGYIGAAGVAFSRIGEVLVSDSGDTNFDREVTIHELAHQWAGNQLETSWLWEGQAEYATRSLAPRLGISLRPDHAAWESLGYTDPLARWWNGSEVLDSAYWYGKSGSFWFAYEAAVGGRENMKAILAQVAADEAEWPLDGEWFLDTGERVSGANLDSLFLQWVYPPETATKRLQERRGAWDARAALMVEASARGLTGEPAGIRLNLNEWNFPAARRDIDSARSALVTYDKAVAEAAAAGLPVALEPVQKAWAEGTLAELHSLVEAQRTAIQVIDDSTEALADEPEGSLALAAMKDAREAYAAGDFAGAARMATEALTDSLNLESARRMIEAAGERQATFSESFLEKVGLLWSDPAGDLEAARAAYADGRGTDALSLATSAYDKWGSAEKDGMFRLAVGAGVTCAALVLIAYVAGKRQSRRAQAAHRAEAVANRPSWRDLENTK